MDGTETLSPVKRVTPLSKYLAMVLFILMPFIGGYIGYTYAPAKIIEIEKIVYREAPVPPSALIENSSDQSERDTEGQGLLSVEACDEAKNNFTLPPQQTLFSDPEGRYSITIPEGMVYTYDEEYGDLNLWSKENWDYMKGLVSACKFFEGSLSINIHFVSEENIRFLNELTSSEIIQNVNIDGDTIPLYAPIATLAGHLEVRVPIESGLLVISYADVNVGWEKELLPVFQNLRIKKF